MLSLEILPSKKESTFWAVGQPVRRDLRVSQFPWGTSKPIPARSWQRGEIRKLTTTPANMVKRRPGDSLLFRDKAVGTPKEQQAAAVVHKSLDSLVTETPLRNGLPGSGLVDRHALVRSAVRALANSDSFIDILVSELDKSGLLRQ
jgi:hypothetical protein